VSLRLRLTLGLVALAAVGLTVAGFVTYSALRSSLYDRIDEQLVEAREPVLVSLRPGTPQQRNRAGAIRSLPPGTYGELRDSDGEMIVSATLIDDELPPEGPNIPADDVVGREEGKPFTYDGWRVRVDPTLAARATVLVAVPLDDVQATLSRLIRIEIVVALAVLAGLALLAWWVVGVGLRPLEAMGETAGAIAAGDLSRRVEPVDDTEVGRLGQSLNEMLHQIEGAFAERTASENRLRRFVADAAHELRTPLTSIRGYAELFRRGAAERPADLARSMSRIEDEAARMGVLVDDLLVLARIDQGRPLVTTTVDLARVVADMTDDARVAHPDRPITVTGSDHEAIVVGDEDRLRQAVSNLVANAMAHTPDATPVEVDVSTGDLADVTITVRDHGSGIPAADRDKVFERFYRVDASRERAHGGGTGLGLSIVAAVAQAHGGRVAVDEPPGGGARFVLTLPRTLMA
jgi:two-component system, OmpR family, sensor kinase